MNLKQIKKDGLVSEQLVVVIDRDINGKQHLVLFEDMDTAKKYTSSDSNKRLITLFRKKV